jgi:hypothetical protein
MQQQLLTMVESFQSVVLTIFKNIINVDINFCFMNVTFTVNS